MKRKVIIPLLAAFALPAAINVYIILIAIRTLRLQGAAAAQADWDFYFSLYLFGTFAVILSLAGVLIAWRFESPLQKAYIAGYAANALVPFVINLVFKSLW